VFERSSATRTIHTIDIDGAFVAPHDDGQAPRFNPVTDKQIGAAGSTIVVKPSEMTMADFHG
jgi:hypothetical protein